MSTVASDSTLNVVPVLGRFCVFWRGDKQCIDERLFLPVIVSAGDVAPFNWVISKTYYVCMFVFETKTSLLRHIWSN